jgi:hypothetical protein
LGIGSFYPNAKFNSLLGHETKKLLAPCLADRISPGRQLMSMAGRTAARARSSTRSLSAPEGDNAALQQVVGRSPFLDPADGQRAKQRLEPLALQQPAGGVRARLSRSSTRIERPLHAALAVADAPEHA